MMLLKVVLFVSISVCFCDNDNRPLVTTPLGRIRGYHKTSHDGRKFAAFEGIPFAKPPVGQRRFEEPEPVDPWHGTWDARYLTSCAQTSMTQPNVTEGAEDCLHINVYVPREVPTPGEGLDVVVHVHGGAYMYGSGHVYARPDFLMDRDLIFVTFNYRLGVFGFLSTEDEVVPGNMGLKDQVMALRWVQKNIDSFGGNPNSVTLTGLSAGGSSVHFHYFSPLSEGLFQRGFSQSGAATNCWSLQEDGLAKAKLLGGSMGCPIGGTTRELVQCLKERPMEQILGKVWLFFKYQFLPFAPFAPVVEEKGPSAFLTDYPFNLLKAGKVLDVPWISSNTQHEGIFPSIFMVNDLENVNQNWKSLAPAFFDFIYTLPKTQHETASQQILEYYLGKNQKLTQGNSDQLAKMFTDRIFIIDAESATKLQAKTAKSPVYYYFFTYFGDFNQVKGVGHGDDAKYFFGNIFEPRPLSENELKMKDVMLDMLVTYAKKGTPVIKGADWRPTQGDQLTYLEIGGPEDGQMTLKTSSDLSGAKDFWNSLGLSDTESFTSMTQQLRKIMVPHFLILLFISLAQCSRPLVQTPLGAIQGHTKTSHNGRNFSAFEGVPFAKPPVGPKRFEPPEPVDPWHGTWDARHLVTCAQTHMTQPNVTAGSEDCLYVNVYVPGEVPTPGKQLDVVVHIHGGAFMYCSGHYYAKPEFLMDRDLVFVTFNYRLGVFGFLSTEDGVVPGNMGLKDQVMALRWVQNNIASFGGNPNSVTLTGVSAGGSSVHFHYFSPLSEGLFQRGFSQSGTATNCWSLQEDGLAKAKLLGGSMGCPIGGTTRELVECLKERPMEQILGKIGLFFKYQFLPFAPFAPVVEEKGPNAFLTDHPYNLLKAGKVLDVPWISSNTQHEGTFPSLSLMNDLDHIYQNWESLAPTFFEFIHTLPPSQHERVSEQILEYYLGKNQKLTQENSDKFTKMFSDRIFLIDSESATKLQAKTAKSPVYYYFFTYFGDFNQLKVVGHGDDAKYFFGSVFVPRPLTENELKMKDVMLDMLVTYAKTGTPVIKGADWRPTQGDQLTYLDIGGLEDGEIKVKTCGDLSGARDFWNSLGLMDSENFGSTKEEL
ncbi:Venom carboxylesterase-6-like Protein [Tribolium castaneum]|uniref:Venom carboxylesterase-6-like Protein n=1 Tax=Tribolium castaneum TaxID=7070 RepID=A0A139WAC0_TRICA|nr:Venom carboxylesterase-6-like Protein [Tribolium castaneum]